MGDAVNEGEQFEFRLEISSETGDDILQSDEFLRTGGGEPREEAAVDDDVGEVDDFRHLGEAFGEVGTHGLVTLDEFDELPKTSDGRGLRKKTASGGREGGETEGAEIEEKLREERREVVNER